MCSLKSLFNWPINFEFAQLLHFTLRVQKDVCIIFSNPKALSDSGFKFFLPAPIKLPMIFVYLKESFLISQFKAQNQAKLFE